jgi:small-conductance mechanosensitive channel
VALILLGFPGVQHIGATLMASAGLIGIAVGAAAQPALKSLIAGVQVAMTEPIASVISWWWMASGRVEDIRLSYVVISTGDERRLIVPTVKFLDNAFQNWTRVEGITGAVVVPIRPGFDVEPLRKAFLAALAADEAWDGRQGAGGVGCACRLGGAEAGGERASLRCSTRCCRGCASDAGMAARKPARGALHRNLMRRAATRHFGEGACLCAGQKNPAQGRVLKFWERMPERRDPFAAGAGGFKCVNFIEW